MLSKMVVAGNVKQPPARRPQADTELSTRLYFVCSSYTGGRKRRLVIARSEATKQSNESSGGNVLDCFAPLAMTGHSFWPPV